MTLAIVSLLQLYLFYLTVDKLVQVPKEFKTKKIILLFSAGIWFMAFLFFIHLIYKELKIINKNK